MSDQLNDPGGPYRSDRPSAARARGSEGIEPPMLDAGQVRALLEELADLLGDTGPLIELTVAGGAYLATLGLRAATRDIDSITPLPDEVRQAAAQVARQHGLAPDWLNDRAAPFRPAAMSPQLPGDELVLCARGRLRVFGAGPDAVLLMKLSAARSVDIQDILVLWPLTSYRTADDVVRAYEAAYPHEESDEHMLTWVQTLIDASGH